MKNENDRSRRIRVTAAVCAMVIVAGGAAGIYSFRNSDEAGAVPEKSAAVNAAAASDDSIISAGGTITSAQLSDTLGLKDTSVRLTVEEVLVSSGDTVTAGTPLYSITSDSLAKAEKTLRSELQSANSVLLEEKISYQTDKNEAYLLYQSELLLGDTAKNEYDSGMSSLDSELKEADASYKEALNTVNSTPSQISAKKSEMNSKQASADSLQSRKDQLQHEVNEAKSAYDQAAERYNRVTAEYNAAAGVVRYLGNALGRDISDIVLAQTVSAVKEERSSVPAEGGDSRPDGESVPDMSGMPQDGRSFRATSFYSEAVSSEEEETPEISAEEIAANALNEGLEAMYSTALEDYFSKKEELSRAEEEMKNTESDYRAKSDSLTECSSELKEAQSSVSSISKEISELESALYKAKSNLSRLRSEYNSLNASYTTDQLELKNKLDTDTVSYENAEYHYQVTLSTIEDELTAAQEAYDTAEENLRIYEESLADGYKCRAGRHHLLTQLSGRQEREYQHTLCVLRGRERIQYSS